jgi:hypothetical protein
MWSSGQAKWPSQAVKAAGTLISVSVWGKIQHRLMEKEKKTMCCRYDLGNEKSEK